MREKFTLVCRATGFLIFCYSIMTILMTLSMLIMSPDMEKMIGVSSIYMGSELMNQLLMSSKSSAEYRWMYCLTTIALSGLIPMCFGLYLMVSGVFFIDLCCPLSTTSEQTTGQAYMEPHNDIGNDRKFMPPEVRLGKESGRDIGHSAK